MDNWRTERTCGSENVLWPDILFLGVQNGGPDVMSLPLRMLFRGMNNGVELSLNNRDTIGMEQDENSLRQAGISGGDLVSNGFHQTSFCSFLTLSFPPFLPPWHSCMS